MNSHVSRAALVALVTAILLVPGLAVAECPTDSDVLAYEVAETMMIRGGGAGRREATATLVGWAQKGTPICPVTLALALNVDACALSVTASDFIRLDTGRGPVQGKFYVVGQDSNNADGPEEIIIEGSLRGTIDLSQAQSGLASLTGGSLHARGVKNTVTDVVLNQLFRAEFDGLFRLPFKIGSQAYYACPGGPQEVAPDEMSLGTATVRLEITFE